MALSANTVWEIRTTGNDTNGGGFVYGSTGTDYSQQASPQVTYTDLYIVTGTTISSAANPFTAAHVGNIINITGGGGFTTGRYQIVSVDGSNVATVDRTIGIADSSNGAGRLGGAFATLGAVASAITTANVAGMTVHVIGGPYVLTSVVSIATVRSHWFGHGTTRWDGGFATVNPGAADNFALIGIASGGGNSYVNGFQCTTANSRTGIKAFSTGNQTVTFHRCKVTGSGIAEGFSGSSGTFIDCLAQGCTTGFYRILNGIRCRATQCVTGFYADGTAVLVECIADNGTGASSNGYSFETGPEFLFRCVAYTCVRGMNFASSVSAVVVQNCIIYGCTDGIRSSGTISRARFFYCAFGGNTADFSTATAVLPENIINKITLTVSPFTSASNYSLNNTAGGGALLRGTGFGTFIDGTHVGYPDIGAVQHQETGGGGSVAPFASLIRSEIR